MSEAPREESDQLPEDAPPEQVVEDTAERARDDATKSAGGADGHEDRSTGLPGDAELRRERE